MKRLILFMIALGFSMCLLAQNSENGIPSNVKKAFETKYPFVKKAKWEKEGELFEAEFKQNGEEYSALFDAAGQCLEIEQEVEKEYVPSTALDFVAKTYSGYKISETALITKMNGDIIYEVEVSKGREKMDLLFSETGLPLK